MSAIKSTNVRKLVMTFGVLFALVFMFSCSGEPPKPNDIQGDGYTYTKEWVTWYITNELIKKTKVPSVAVALVDDQEVIWQDAFGFANLEEQIPATVNTVYKMGSVSKPFTGLAIMKLYEDGIIDIDAPITNYLPDFSMQSRFPDSDPITIRSIMSHRAGYPRRSAQAGAEGLYGSSERISLKEIVDQLKDEYIALPVGYRFKYSNLGITILGRIIEAVTGTEFTEYMQETILNPLGMNNSSYLSSPELEENLAMGYENYDNKTEPQPPFDFSDLPAANLYSTLGDMTKFLQFVFKSGTVDDNQLIEKETLEMMYGDYYSRPRDPITTGLTFTLDRLTSGHFVVGHDGSVPGFFVYTVFLPNEKLGFVLLSNSYDTPLFPAYFKVLELMLETKGGIKPQAVEMPTPVNVDTTILEQYTGKYSLSTLLDVSLKGNTLQIKFQTGQTVNLIPVSEKKFIFPPLAEMLFGRSTIEFFVGDESEEDVLIWEYIDAGWYDVCPKVPMVEEIPPLWYELTGKYTMAISSSQETAGEAEVSIIDNILVGSLTFYANNFTAPIVVNPISETEILIVGGPYGGETILYDGDNGSLKWGGFTAKPIEQEIGTAQIHPMQLHEILKYSKSFRR